MADRDYAARTDVPTSRSRDEIERTVARFGATHFAYGTAPGMAQVGFEMRGRQVLLRLPLPDPTDRQFTHTRHRDRFRQEPLSKEAAAQRYDQAVRQRWRALAAVVLAKFAAIEAGISTFEREFLVDMRLPSGQTVGDALAPHIETALASGRLPELMPGMDGAR
jgi:hypothetical protein